MGTLVPAGKGENSIGPGIRFNAAERLNFLCRSAKRFGLRLCEVARLLKYRFCKAEDCAALAEMNLQLIQDEGHRNRMTLLQLEQRMRGWLAGEYKAVLFEDGQNMVAYALFREQPEELYLRQLFVIRERRRQGVGREAMTILLSEIWPKNKRLTVDVLIGNRAAIAFWRAMGYVDYCLTLEIPQRG